MKEVVDGLSVGNVRYFGDAKTKSVARRIFGFVGCAE